MNKIKLYIAILLFVGLPALNSCSGWLDVKTKDQLLENEIYDKEETIQGVLTGFYLTMSDRKMYGGNLTMTTCDALAQYHYSTNTLLKEVYMVSNFQYKQKEVDQIFGEVWTSSYELILKINDFIAKVNDSKVISDSSRRLMLGEAYGLRAFIHFDLFRLFGPIYKGGESTESLPYNTSSVLEDQTYLSASDFIEKVLADIKTSKEFLSDDPILTLGNLDRGYTNVSNKLYTFRNRKMNYYAARALEARVLQYAGKESEAAIIAKEILTSTVESGSKKNFFWTPSSKSEMVTDESGVTFTAFALSANQTGYYDAIFGLENINLYQNWKLFFNVGNASYSTSAVVLHGSIFESDAALFENEEDARTKSWTVLSAAPDRYVSGKFAEPANTVINEANSPLLNFQPLMRISELYYMIAENDMNQGRREEAIKTLNLVLSARGVIDRNLLPESATEAEFFSELQREYYREFYGEGQTFFYHKRRVEPYMIDPVKVGTKKVEPYNYVVSIPTAETDA